MLSAVKRGDRVVTVGGLHATVADVKDEILSLDLAPNVRVKADRSAISYVRSRGDEPSKSES
jgi:preprotein translocase subunit YajC